MVGFNEKALQTIYHLLVQYHIMLVPLDRARPFGPLTASRSRVRLLVVRWRSHHRGNQAGGSHGGVFHQDAGIHGGKHIT